MHNRGLQSSFKGSPKTVDRKWHLVDAEGKVLGRLATRIARILQGKTKPQYTPNADCGDFVVVTNAHKIKLTGDKLATKEYQFFSGYPNGQKTKTAKEMIAKRPEEVIRLAVRRMLPKSRLGRRMLVKLKIHKELPAHGYKAQQPVPLAAPAVAGVGS
jgi:large subunit ribosomal protein L13